MPSILEISVFEHQTCQTILTSKIYPVVAHVQYQFVSFQKNHCEHPTIIKIVCCCSIAHNLMLSPAVIFWVCLVDQGRHTYNEGISFSGFKMWHLNDFIERTMYLLLVIYSDISHLVLCHAIIFCICSIAQRRKRQVFESATSKYDIFTT